MFENLTGKLGKVFDRLSSKGRLTEKDVDEALKEVRIALLEADVNFRVVKSFLKTVHDVDEIAGFMVYIKLIL